MITRTKASIGIAALCCAALVAAGAPAVAAGPVDTRPLTDAVTVDGMKAHLAALQAIANANGGNRAADTAGYDASVDYVVATMEAAGYTVATQPFEYTLSSYENSAFEQVAPTPTNYAFDDDFYPMAYSVERDVTAAVSVVDPDSANSGCEATDFAGFTLGNIALIRRGTCDFALKAANAEAAGAVGVVIYNAGDSDAEDRHFAFGGTLGGPGIGIPVTSTTYELGVALRQIPGLVVRIMIDEALTTVATENVIATSPAGRTDRKVVVGAHLDSVHDGAGINDNGSGTAALLEIAEQIDELGITPRNQLVFAFWGGEEDGLNGSNYYVSQLSKTQIKQTAVNLNFDMLGSPNGGRFIYDGDGGAFGSTGPNGSDIVEDVFEGWFGARGLYTEPTEFDGRSDYFAFINAGIPAGGLFSGAEVLKTAEQAQDDLFGGTAGVAFDPCYHADCDTLANIDDTLYEELADAAAHAVYTFADTTSAVNGTAKGKALGKITWDYEGNLALR